MPRISRGNEAAGRIKSMMGTAGGSTPGAGRSGMPAVPQGTEAAGQIASIRSAAGSAKGANPGEPPHRGLTKPGVVEQAIAASMGATRRTGDDSLDPIVRLPIQGAMRRG